MGCVPVAIVALYMTFGCEKGSNALLIKGEVKKLDTRRDITKEESSQNPPTQL